MTVVFYISGHGFGHTTRQLEIIRHIHQLKPEARIVVRTSVPRWFIERSAPLTVDVQPCDTDTGIKQIDSLLLDESETIRLAARFYQTFAERVGAEAGSLRALGAKIVVGDVPPLAFAAAAEAQVPSLAVANFTWDWIYAAYPAFGEVAPQVLTMIGDAYAKADLALRLPFSGGFETIQSIDDVPLVARTSRRSRDDNRRILDLPSTRPIVLASFGGHGAVMPYEQIAATHDITLVVTDHELVAGQDARPLDRLRCFSGQDLEQRAIRYEDLVSAADIVVSKPGYGIVSECIANHTALLYTWRGVFAENEVLIAGMQPFLRNHFIGQDDLRAGRWESALRDLLQQPPPASAMRTDGARVVADIIQRRL